jgi:type IV pilus assembly protein PilM
MASNTTTIYIDDASIRLMVTRGKRISKLADVPLDMRLADIDAEGKKEELIERIKQLFKSNKITAKKVIVGLSGLHCLTRPIVLPELPRTMLDEAITREARRVLPVPLEQLYISWQIVSMTEGKMEAFMVAVPRHIADNLIDILNRAGYKPYLMDIKPLALARLSREATAIIVDVQSTEFDIIVMVNGIPQPIRTVSFPEESLSLDEKLHVVKDELKRTVEFYNSNNPENPLQHNDILYVSGELSDEPELYDSLTQELGFQVTPLTSPLKCMKQLDPSHHLINVGLALKEMTKEAGPLRPNFNTLPVPYQPKQISMNKLMAIPATAAAVGLIVLLAMTVRDAAGSIEAVQNDLQMTNFLLEKKQAQKNKLLQDITAAEGKLSKIEEQRADFTSALTIVNDDGDRINGDLVAAVDNRVDDFYVTSIGHSGSQVSISGAAESEQEVMRYVRELYKTGRFAEITISNLSRSMSSDNTTEIMSYALAVRLKES